MWWLWVAVLASAAGARAEAAAAAGARAEAAAGGFAFFRALRRTGAGTRRVFGGAPAGSWAPAAALLDRALVALCSGAVLAPRWALTAAHCARPGVAFVRYSGRTADDDLAAVYLLYAHPQYKVRHADEGAGLDVVLLHHDVGLVQTSRDMILAASASTPSPAPAPAPAAAFDPDPAGGTTAFLRFSPPPPRLDDPVAVLSPYEVDSILGQEIQMLGYGRTERAGAGTALRGARLRVVACQRGAEAWRHCGCALGNASGVCSGDSGGPVLFMGRQIGVTSMGPLQCARGPAGAAGAGSAPALSVFTALRPYAALINATISGSPHATRMRQLPSRAPRLAAAPLLLLLRLLTDHTLPDH